MLSIFNSLHKGPKIGLSIKKLYIKVYMAAHRLGDARLPYFVQ